MGTQTQTINVRKILLFDSFNMPKRSKEREYKIGCHPIKAVVNQWLTNVTRKVINSNVPWAFVLESEATLTIQSLTQQSTLQGSTTNHTIRIRQKMA